MVLASGEKATDPDWEDLEYSPSYISSNINVLKKKKLNFTTVLFGAK